MAIAAILSCIAPANAQRVVGNEKDALIAAQLARVSAALEKLAPTQVAACWLSPQVLPLIGLASLEDKSIPVTVTRVETGAALASVQSGDVLVSIESEEIKRSELTKRQAAGTTRIAPFNQLLEYGRSFVETYKNAQGQLVSVANPVKLACKANDIFISDDKSDRAATRLFFGLSISGSRLALLNDDQLLAFLAWNHAFMALRHESNADFFGFIAALGNPNSRANYVYGSGTHEKIDWVTLRTLRALDADVNSYGNMISAVEAFDAAAGFSLLGSKRFIHPDSGQSPRGGEEKQARLAKWAKLLEQDAQALAPDSLKVSNKLLSWPTWSARTMPLTIYQTVGDALSPLLGEVQAKDFAERYLSSFDWMKSKAEKSVSGQQGSAEISPGFQMLYVHHGSKRLIWVARLKPSDSDGGLCTLPNDCSVIAVGPHIVARPSPAWAEELQAAPGAYKLEEIR